MVIEADKLLLDRMEEIDKSVEDTCLRNPKATRSTCERAVTFGRLAALELELEALIAALGDERKGS